MSNMAALAPSTNTFWPDAILENNSIKVADINLALILLGVEIRHTFDNHWPDSLGINLVSFNFFLLVNLEMELA